MTGPIAVLIAAGIIVLGGIGLYRVAYAQGYACACEDMREETTFTPDGED